MKTVIVYYSLGGFTKKIAQQLAAKTGADLLRLTPVRLLLFSSPPTATMLPPVM